MVRPGGHGIPVSARACGLAGDSPKHPRIMIRRFHPVIPPAALLAILAAMLLGFLAPTSARADPADIAAAARGVVRVVVIGTDGEEIYPISHGTGFAVSPTRIVTNAHVVMQARADDSLRIGIVPSEGNDTEYVQVVDVSPRNDLALLAIQGDLRLPPLSIAGGTASDNGEVSAVGYPMNVDRAQGLANGDIFRSQPPVKSRGFLSGARPSRQFDTVLHTAPIARGNSGGPLLDQCGRVLGVNSFGADSDGSDAEFYFAVSDRELLPFLRANGVQPVVNAMPCRSLAELDAAEQTRRDEQQRAARLQLSQEAEAQRTRRQRAQLEAEMAVAQERENAMAFAALLMVAALAAAGLAWRAGQKHAEAADREEDEFDSHAGNRLPMLAFAGVAVLAAAASAGIWLTRPGLAEIDRRVTAVMADGRGGDSVSPQAALPAAADLICTLDPARSRVTGPANEEIAFSFDRQGCVNGRTQYGFAGGTWSRLFVPNEEAAVSVNSFDPGSRTYRMERYLLPRAGMEAARSARADYSAPACGSDEPATLLGERQSAVAALLPDAPNERLVYDCRATEG